MFTSSANLSLCAAALTPYTCGLKFTFMNDSLKKAVWNKMERDAIELLTDDASETSTASSNQISGPALYSSESSDESAETIQAICVRKALENLRKHWSNNHQTYQHNEDEYADPVRWWSTNPFAQSSTMIPILPYVRAALQTPASSSLSASIFSKSSSVKTSGRERLKPEAV